MISYLPLIQRPRTPFGGEVLVTGISSKEESPNENVERRRKKSVHHRARSGGTELSETNALRCVALFLPAHPVISFPRSHGMGEEAARNEWTVRKMELC